MEDVAEAVTEAEFVLDVAGKAKGSVKALRAALVDARAQLLTLEICRSKEMIM